MNIWFSLVVLVLVLLFVAGCSTSPEQPKKEPVKQEQMTQTPKSNVPQDEHQIPKKLEYKVVDKEDISFGVVKRFTYCIVVPSSADKQYLESVVKEVVEKVKKESPLNCIAFFFYDREEDSGGAYTIGKAEWAPYGDWARASEVKSGDYSKHQIVIEVKDKKPAPSEEEFAIHDEIKAILKGPGNPYNENPPAGADFKQWTKENSEKIRQWEAKAFEAVAKKYNITPQKAKEIYLKVEMR